MSQNKFLVPVGDLKVRHPQGGYLAPAGDHVVVDSYWRKRISDGSVIEGEAPVEPAAEATDTAVASAKAKSAAKGQE
ncbi:MAG: DUF2635 domain-containing protein [Pseudomonas sp.]|nr:DUF2635 domain-containing protein [Pseudomonas sp.]